LVYRDARLAVRCVRQFSKAARIENNLAFLSINKNSENVRLRNLRLHKRRPFVAATFSLRKAFGDRPVSRPVQTALSAPFASAPDRNDRRQCVVERARGRL